MIDIEYLGDLILEAGEAVLDVYGSDFSVEQKEDRSPLTLADMQSHRIISRGLRSRYPDIPVISEEGREIPYRERAGMERFWLVDPLDGTKEFIKRNGDFTVNIALVEGRTPVIGLIYVPVEGTLYAADIRKGCTKTIRTGRFPLRVEPVRPDAPIRIVKSRSHPSPKLQSLIDLLPASETVARGSSLKFCAVASGEADFYPRLGPTWEWDTAAGQAVLVAAGGVMTDFRGNPFSYNKEDLLNGPFLAASDPRWLEASGIIPTISTWDLS